MNESLKLKDDERSILIVDDAPANIQLVANILKNQGYKLAYAQNGEKAIELTKKEKFDIIILDVMMPEMDGFEVCRRLKNDPDSSDIPVLFLTAKTDTESIVQGFETGAVDYVAKPVSEAELSARVRNHLELYRYRRELKSMNIALRREILEKKRAERRYRSIYENAVQGMFQITFEGKLISSNPAYARIFGYDSPEEMAQLENVSDLLYHDREDRENMVSELTQKGFVSGYEFKSKTKDGKTIWLLVNARLTTDDTNQLIIEGIVMDNTVKKLAEDELKRSRERYRYLSVHDSLTGLYNTRYLYSRLAELIKSANPDTSPFSLVFLDIDNFKRVVDTYGHLNGSRAIAEVAATVNKTIEEPAFGVAYAGDEFVVVLPGYGKEQAMEKAEEIRSEMRDTVYLSQQGHNVNLHASFGISTYPDDADDMTDLLIQADRAMFDVKEKGKDGVGDCRHMGSDRFDGF